MIIDCHTNFQPLKEVWLGGTYPIEFYDNLDNQLHECFHKLTEDTENTLSKMQKILIDHDVTVRRPEFDTDSSNYRDNNDMLIKPPMSPRDFSMCLANTLYFLDHGWKINPYRKVLDEYKSKGENVHVVDRSQSYAWVGYGEVVRMGKDLYYDVLMEQTDPKRLKTCTEGFKKLGLGYRQHLLHFGGHADGVFCPVKEGVIISTHYGEKEIYEQTFPGWRVHWLPDVTVKRRENAKRSKVMPEHHRWWIPDNFYHSPVFNNYIMESVRHWTGDSTETIFDVNCLVIDEKNVICFCEDDTILNIFHKEGITPHVVDHPTRGFWDAGFHCMSTDVHRKGGKQDYFPSRPLNFHKEYK